MHEGAEQTSKDKGQEDAARFWIIDPDEVEDVLGKHESAGGKTRVDDAVDERINVGAAHNDNDEDAEALECLLDERGNKSCAKGIGLLEIADREDDVLLEGGVKDTRGQSCDSRAPQEQSHLRLPGLWLPSVDEQDEADNDEERNGSEKTRLDKRGDTR